MSVPTSVPPATHGASKFPIDLFTDEIGIIGSDASRRRTLAVTGEVVTGLAWLPDGRLSYTTETDDVIGGLLEVRGHLYAEPRVGGAARLLYEASNPLAVEWSPQGDWAAIQRRAVRVYETPGLLLMSGDGKQSIELGPLQDAGAWLPDGRYAFVSQGQLMIVRPGESPRPAVTNAPPATGTPAPSPDGSRLLVNTPDHGFIVVNVAASTVSGLSNRDVTGPPVWSPNGTHVLYETGIGVGLPDPKLWIYDVSSGTSNVLLSGVQFIGGYDWSPDGARVAFTIHNGADAGLHVIDVRTRQRSTVLSEPDMSEPVWSRDGNVMAVNRSACWRGCGRGPIDVVLVVNGAARTLPYATGIFSGWRAGQPLVWGGSALMAADPSGTSRQLEGMPDSTYRIAASSPDGRSVAFVRSAAPAFYTFEVNVRSAAFRAVPNPAHPEAHRAELNPTAISPDGMSVASQRDGDIYITRRGTAERLLARLPHTRGCGTIQQPIWSPGSSYLAYDGCLPGVYVVNVATGNVVQLVRRAWCFFADEPATLRWTRDDTLVVTANPTLC